MRGYETVVLLAMLAIPGMMAESLHDIGRSNKLQKTTERAEEPRGLHGKGGRGSHGRNPRDDDDATPDRVTPSPTADQPFSPPAPTPETPQPTPEITDEPVTAPVPTPETPQPAAEITDAPVAPPTPMPATPVTESPAQTSSPTPTDMELLLELHNEARCFHNADPLTWSSDVAASAMVHAEVLTSSENCGDLFHSTSDERNGYGENLYMCWGSQTCYSAENAMQGLYEDEIQTDDVTEYGGHATQILWKSTTELGCVVDTCSTDNNQSYTYLVCQYNPPGNYVGRVEEEVDLLSSSNSC